jgi:hypothetical protein
MGISELFSTANNTEVDEIGTGQKEHRQYERVPHFGPIRICWETDEGMVSYASAKCLDVSEEGLRIELAEPIPVRTRILLRADRINFSGSATVRSRTWRGCKYILGLNLTQAQRIDFGVNCAV